MMLDVTFISDLEALALEIIKMIGSNHGCYRIEVCHNGKTSSLYFMRPDN